ncbi:hypothetical protein B0T22DRAFT_445908 [Podospora appendiculata]|uniref:Heterokaryon incompatibility domain-containing protein n=1 Tax=Podospora appendiculata TaxID=314037 RepID=A0AAE0WZA7_9PEZI|nr:hypothetical protein B0T22DRAFT_445908 [Podospora appendiculata]
MENDYWSVYMYYGLPPFGNRIRLLERPGEWSAPIECELKSHSFSLDDEALPPYVTLSYVWGSFSCINQNDDGERSHQVQLMGQVYSKCNEVAIFLGDAKADRAVKNAWKKGAGRRAEFDLENGIHGLASFPTSDLFKQDDPSMEYVLEDLRVMLLSPWLSLNQNHAKVLGHFARTVINIDNLQARFRVDHGVDLHHLLTGFASRRSTDDRDRIFGLLGLAKPGNSIIPDYGLEVIDVYQKAAVALLNKSRTFSSLGSLVWRKRGYRWRRLTDLHDRDNDKWLNVFQTDMATTNNTKLTE